MSEGRVCYTCKVWKPGSEFTIKRQAKSGLNPWCRSCAKLRPRKNLDPKIKAAYDRRRLLENPHLKDRARVLHAKTYPARRSAIIERVAAWSKANPEKRRAISANYKHRRRAIERAGLTVSEFKAWVDQQQKVCFYCGIECAHKFEVDHYYPLSKGGKHEVENLRIACPSCNRRKSAKIPSEFMKAAA